MASRCYLPLPFQAFLAKGFPLAQVPKGQKLQDESHETKETFSCMLKVE
jgi:hypothetical protein